MNRRNPPTPPARRLPDPARLLVGLVAPALSVIFVVGLPEVPEARLVVPPNGDAGAYDLTGDPERQIRDMVTGTYLPGLSRMDLGLLGRCLLADTRHVGIEGTGVESALTPEWVALQRARQDASSSEDLADASVEWVDATGDVAQVKVKLEFGGATATDLLSLMRLGGEWRVVAKTTVFDEVSPRGAAPDLESTLREFLAAEEAVDARPQNLRERCHPEVELRAARRDGTLWSHTGFHQWEQDPLRREAGRLAAMRVLSTETDGALASVKLESTYGSTRLIDYWTLRATDDGWQVLSRVTTRAVS